MTTLRRIVHVRVLLAGIVPLLVLTVATAVVLVRHAVHSAVDESTTRAIRTAASIDEGTALLEYHLRTMLEGAMEPDGTPSREILRRWVARDSAVCLLSLWKGDSMLASVPRPDVARMLPERERSWSEVAIDPRCDEPVVRHAIWIGRDTVAEVSLRLSYVSRALLDPMRSAKLDLSLVDEQGVYVADFRNEMLGQKEVDPLVGRIRAKGPSASGMVFESGRLVGYRAQRLVAQPWTMIARSDALDAILPLLPLLAMVAGFAFLSLALVASLVRDASRRILEPLDRLRESLGALEKGESAVRLPASDVAEIDALSASFGRMARSIEEREEARRVELERAIAELEAFSYSVSHDLRSPLRSIDGFASVVEEEDGHNLSQEGRSALVRIRAAARRMGDLIDHLLRLARTSRMPLSVRRVDMDELVREVVEELDAGKGEREVAWSVGRLGGADCDPGLILQVWRNLLSNALKYTGRTPRAEIAVGREILAGEVRWWVRDNGVGFDPAMARKLFGTFQRLHGMDEFEGSGIGLALVKRIVQRHGGTVHATASPGGGATFSFTLPTARRDS